jgi:hypothetical protein
MTDAERELATLSSMLTAVENIHLTLPDIRATLERMSKLIDQIALGLQLAPCAALSSRAKRTVAGVACLEPERIAGLVSFRLPAVCRTVSWSESSHAGDRSRSMAADGSGGCGRCHSRGSLTPRSPRGEPEPQ